MLLTSRDKPIYINPLQIVALTQCTPSERDTLGANCCIHCTSGSFLVKETFEQVYLRLNSNGEPQLADFKANNKTTSITEVQELLEASNIPVQTPILRTRRRAPQ